MAVPNYKAEVEAMAARYPEAWRNAHTNGPGTEDFIRLLAAHLHANDPKFGLCGQRGNPDVIGDDSLTYKGEGDQFDPTDGNKPISVIDVIGGAGGPNPQPAWGLYPGDRHAAAWVKPAGAVVVPPKPICPDPSVHGKPLCPSPKAHEPKAYPRDESVWDVVFARLEIDMEKRGQALNAGSGRWAARTIWRVINEGMSLEESVAKSEREWREILGL